MNRVSFIFLSFGLSVLVLLSACSPAAQSAAAQSPPTPTVQPPAPVEVATIQTGDIDQVFDYSGTLQAKQTVSLIPNASGRIESVLVQVGDEVKAGDPIAVIKHDTYEAQVEQAEAALTKARLNLAKMKEGSRPEKITAAQAAVDLARANVNDVANVNDNERTVAASNLANAETALRQAQAEYDKIAWAGDVGDTPQAAALEQATIAYQTALANYNLATNPSDSTLAPLMAQLSQAELNLALTLKPYRDIDIQMAQADVNQAEAAAKLAHLQLDETTIEAPFDGVVGELYITEGTTVGPQTPVAMFVSRSLEVLVNVEEERISNISENQNAGLNVVSYPGQSFPGVVTSVALVADSESHTFVVKVTPLDKEGLLRSGMSADVSLLAKGDQNALLAPRAAVTVIDGKNVVYVVKDDNSVEQRPVQTGLANNNHVEILSGLQAGDKVVVAGQSNLTDGAPVKIVKGV
jgi:multidrug efflux pump subunit AcrA (membrane-fusion protein)